MLSGALDHCKPSKFLLEHIMYPLQKFKGDVAIKGVQVA